MTKPIRAVLFDFDGTLADSFSAIAASVNHVRSHHQLQELSEEYVIKFVGHGLEQLMADLVPVGSLEDNIQLYRKHHLTIMVSKTHLLPGVVPTLSQLHQAGIRLAVCSNKPVAITRMLIEALGIAPFFDRVYGPEDSGKPKPDPGMLVLALKNWHIAPDQALMIGDMPVDVQTARNAGVRVWVVSTGSSDLEILQSSNPDRILNSLNEVVSIILSSH